MQYVFNGMNENTMHFFKAYMFTREQYMNYF